MASQTSNTNDLHRKKAGQYLDALRELTNNPSGELPGGTPQERKTLKGYCYGALAELTAIEQAAFTPQDLNLLDETAAYLMRTANAYYIGNGTKDRPEIECNADYAEAKDCFGCCNIAAQLGETDAFHLLGKLYYTGCGTKKNDAEAVKWFEKSIAAGKRDAAISLAYCYLNGNGTEKNIAMARELAASEAGAGNPLAQHLLELIAQEEPGSETVSMWDVSSETPDDDEKTVAFSDTPNMNYNGQEPVISAPSYTAPQSSYAQGNASQYSGASAPQAVFWSGQGNTTQSQSMYPQQGYPSGDQWNKPPSPQMTYGDGYIAPPSPSKPEKKGGTGKVVLLVLLLALVLGGVGFGAFTILSKRSGNSASTQTVQQGDAGTAQGQSGQSETQSQPPVQVETQPQIQAQTQPETQPQTQPQTQPETQPQTQAKQIRHIYDLIVTDQTWEQAAADARSRGGYLATIDSAAEQQVIENLMSSYSSIHTVWLGARKTSASGSFTWSDGSALTYTQWGPGEPNNETGDELYLDMYELDGNWYWNDVPNDISQYYAGKMGYILERETEE